MGLFPLPLSLGKGSCLPLFDGFESPSFIVIPRALFLGGMSMLVLNMSLKQLGKSYEFFNDNHRKIVADRLVDQFGESPNHFGELDQARQKDWLKILKKIW